MTFHYFNPEHDIALAMNTSQFTAPIAARQMRSDLGYIPALWATKGDCVIVDNVEAAIKSYNEHQLALQSEVNFITLSQLPQMIDGKRIVDIQPWGWDKALCHRLRQAGVPDDSLPMIRQLNKIRNLSNRSLAVRLLDKLQGMDGITGFSRLCDTYEQVLLFLDQNRDIVVKAPWSCSGRGIRYIDVETVNENSLHWIVNTLEKQRSVVAEKRCDKVQDFAVLFNTDELGNVKYYGLSVFSTSNGAYTGNLIASDKAKKDYICQYISEDLLHSVIKQIEAFLTEQNDGAYRGYLGVDMMICATHDSGKYLLNPCIEINMRRTMGHLALALARRGQRGTMNFTFENGIHKLTLSNETPIDVKA